MPRGLGRRVAVFAAGSVAALSGVIGGPARASVAVLVIDGRGYGHGVGLAQDGAYWMGVAGARVNQILGQFYPGTAWGRASGEVRVVVQKLAGNDPAAGGPVDTNDTVVEFPGGGQVSDGQDRASQPGFPLSITPGASAHLWFDGTRYHAQALGATTAPASTTPAPTTTARARTAPASSAGTRSTARAVSAPTLPPPTLPRPAPASGGPASTTSTTRPPATPTSTSPGSPPSTAPPASPVVDSAAPLWTIPSGGGTSAIPATGRRYRGVLEFTAGNGPLRVVDHLDVEDYLRGMGEVLDPNWPGSSLQAQAVASRTYALRAMQSGGELCDDDHCQVYLGQQVEHPAMDRAVAATRGLVLVYAHQLADTVFSSNGGAVSATPLEGFGPDAPASIPYLRAGPYLTRDPLPWTVTIGLGDLATRFSYPGSLSGARIGAAGPSGRALEIILDGNRGSFTLDAHRFAAGLGLRSTLITMTVSEADAAPPPPTPADLIQVPPDQVGRMGAAAASAADTGRPLALPVARTVGATAVAARHRSGTLPAAALAAALLGAVVASMMLAGPNWRHE